MNDIAEWGWGFSWDSLCRKCSLRSRMDQQKCSMCCCWNRLGCKKSIQKTIHYTSRVLSFSFFGFFFSQRVDGNMTDISLNMLCVLIILELPQFSSCCYWWSLSNDSSRFISSYSLFASQRRTTFTCWWSRTASSNY